MQPSNVIFLIARRFPAAASNIVKIVAPQIPFNWITARLTSELRLRVPVDAKLPNGLMMRVLLGDGIGKEVLKVSGYERKSVAAIQSFLHPGCVFFDIGAHMGLFTLQAAPLCAAVHAFEPVPETREMLQHNVSVNRLNNVIVNACAISDRQGEVEIYEGAQDNTGTSSLAPPTNYSGRVFRVPSLTLDSYAAAQRVIPSVIKIDVEGAELLVLKGARALLQEKRPVILVEFAPANHARFGYSVDDLAAELQNVGYELRPICEDAKSGYVNMLATSTPR